MSNIIIPGESSTKSPYRCIYCGRGIPPDVGVSCTACSGGVSHKQYDAEFEYSEDIEPSVAKIMAETEQRQVTDASQQAKEEFYRLYEMNAASRKEYRWPNQEELQAKREGKVLHMNEFLRLLKKALPSGFSAWYTDKGGMANTLGLYVGHPAGAASLPSCTHPPGAPHYVGFVQVPYMQEFEELHFDRYQVPLGSKRRGWRTILLKLIESRILTETEAHSVFGEPLGSIISRRYNEYLKFTRDRAATV